MVQGSREAIIYLYLLHITTSLSASLSQVREGTTRHGGMQGERQRIDGLHLVRDRVCAGTQTANVVALIDLNDAVDLSHKHVATHKANRACGTE